MNEQEMYQLTDEDVANRTVCRMTGKHEFIPYPTPPAVSYRVCERCRRVEAFVRDENGWQYVFDISPYRMKYISDHRTI